MFNMLFQKWLSILMKATMRAPKILKEKQGDWSIPYSSASVSVWQVFLHFTRFLSKTNFDKQLIQLTF